MCIRDRNNQDIQVPSEFTFDYKTNTITNEYYNNFGIDAQDSTNFGNFFNGRRVDQGVFGAEAQA